MTDTTFSSRSNAKRAAEKAIAGGTAPSIDYGIKERPSGRFEIAWHDRAAEARERLGMPPTTEAVETEIADALTDGFVEEQDKAAMARQTEEENAAPQPEADPFPKGARVLARISKRHQRLGIVEYRVDATYCRVKLDGPNPSQLFRYDELSLDDGSEPPSRDFGKPWPSLPRKPRAAPSGDRKPSKASELDAQAATGAMPTKPIITSPANREQYQKRFDKLEAMAMAGDWDGVRGYEVKGINSYAKMVKQYRARLLMARDVSIGSRDDDKAA